MATESKRVRASDEEEPDLFREIRAEMRAMEEDLGFVRSRLRSMVDPWVESRGPAGRHPHELTLAAVDIEDRGTTYEVRYDVPGTSKENIEVKVIGQRIEIRAEIPAPHVEPRHSFLMRERAHRGYERVLELPAPVIGTEVQATLDRGVLVLTIPKTRQAAEHRIPIT